MFDPDGISNDSTSVGMGKGIALTHPSATGAAPSDGVAMRVIATTSRSPSTGITSAERSTTTDRFPTVSVSGGNSNRPPDFAASDFKDRTILEQLAGAGVKVRIADGGHVVQDLRIGR